MLKQERHNFIVNEVRIHNRVLLNDLATRLTVSEDTIRRDLKELDRLGKVMKVHGGAMSRGFHLYNYEEQEIYAYKSKVIIAQKAIGLLKDGQVILISGGTTNLELARLLHQNLKATFFTPSLPIAMQLLAHENIQTIFIGGRLSSEGQIATGGSAINTLAQIKADICFLGTGHLDANEGLSEFDWEVVQLKKAMISSSKKVVLLAISEKLNSIQRYQVCKIEAVNTLITELVKDNNLLSLYKNQGVQVI